jgi:hypothetical protein
MTQEYVIVDSSIKYIGAKNPLEENLFYASENSWHRSITKAKKYPDASAAIEQARLLQMELPVKVLLIQNEGNRIGVGEINFNK